VIRGKYPKFQFPSPLYSIKDIVSPKMQCLAYKTKILCETDVLKMHGIIHRLMSNGCLRRFSYPKTIFLGAANAKELSSFIGHAILVDPTLSVPTDILEPHWTMMKEPFSPKVMIENPEYRTITMINMITHLYPLPSTYEDSIDGVMGVFAQLISTFEHLSHTPFSIIVNLYLDTSKMHVFNDQDGYGLDPSREGLVLTKGYPPDPLIPMPSLYSMIAALTKRKFTINFATPADVYIDDALPATVARFCALDRRPKLQALLASKQVCHITFEGEVPLPVVTTSKP